MAGSAAFGDRLRQSTLRQGLPVQVAAFARWYNSGSGERPVTSHAIRKWLLGEACPTQQRVLRLAQLLQVDPTWLRFGTGSPEAGVTDELPSDDLALILAARQLQAGERALLLHLAQVLARNHTVQAETGGRRASTLSCDSAGTEDSPG